MTIEFSHENYKVFDLERRKNEFLTNAQELYPISYGSSTTGLGLISSLYEGLRQMPYLMVEGIILGELGKLIKPAMSYQNFTKFKLGQFKGLNLSYKFNFIRGQAYQSYKLQIKSWNEFIQKSEKAVEKANLVHDIKNAYENIKSINKMDTIKKFQ